VKQLKRTDGTNKKSSGTQTTPIRREEKQRVNDTTSETVLSRI